MKKPPLDSAPKINAGVGVTIKSLWLQVKRNLKENGAISKLKHALTAKLVRVSPKKDNAPMIQNARTLAGDHLQTHLYFLAILFL